MKINRILHLHIALNGDTPLHGQKLVNERLFFKWLMFESEKSRCFNIWTMYVNIHFHLLQGGKKNLTYKKPATLPVFFIIFKSECQCQNIMKYTIALGYNLSMQFSTT
jgi:hypothetical protein